MPAPRLPAAVQPGIEAVAARAYTAITRYLMALVPDGGRTATDGRLVSQTNNQTASQPAKQTNGRKTDRSCPKQGIACTVPLCVFARSPT